MIRSIIFFGWKKQKYLPVRLAPVVLEQAVLGVVESNLLASFLKYVLQTDRATFEASYSDFGKVDMEQLVEVLDIITENQQKATYSKY